MTRHAPRLRAACAILSAGCLFAAATALRAQTVLVEAERFETPGGWVLDQQFMDQMGSPYLLAHGLGVPVPDAVTRVTVPAAGAYRAWVRTRDWVAPWGAPGAPGRFQVLVNGKALDAVFGTSGAAWHWQDGGTVQLPAGPASLALHDLTGFEGRCDAVLLTADRDLVPPNADPAMAAFRRRLLGIADQPEDGGSYELVVAGGGIAGTCAALSAARGGLRVALIQDRPVLGGNNSSEVRVWLGGNVRLPPYPRIGDIVAELEPKKRAHGGPEDTAAIYEDDRRLALVRAETNITLVLEHRVTAVEAEGGAIRAVVAQDTRTGRRVRIAGRWFADCTGDGSVGFLAGADHDVTEAGHMGPSDLWQVADTGRAAPFPRCPWAVDLADKPFPGRQGLSAQWSKGGLDSLGRWFWESGFDKHPVDDVEWMRDQNFRAMYGAWDALKNVDHVYPDHRIVWSAYIAGKRESRRLLGDVVLARQDLTSGRAFPDGCFPCTWGIDLHTPNKAYRKGFEGEEFISQATGDSFPRPYWAPYRCLYSRNIGNLFMAGRDISVTHDALGTVRVMRTCGAMGEVVGMAAAVCAQRNTTPRGVYEQHLPELQARMRQGAGRRAAAAPERPAWLDRAGTNLARRAAVTVSGSLDAGKYPPAMINDGNADVTGNANRWVSAARATNWVELAWDAPQTLGAVRIVSGYVQDGEAGQPIAGFALQWHDGQAWRDVPGASAADNTRVDWSAAFAPVRTSRVRLLITRSHGNVARLWELEAFGPVPDAKSGL